MSRIDDMFEHAIITSTIQKLLRGESVVVDKRTFFLGKSNDKYTLCIEADKVTRTNGKDVLEKTYLAFDMPFGQFLEGILDSHLRKEIK